MKVGVDIDNKIYVIAHFSSLPLEGSKIKLSPMLFLMDANISEEEATKYFDKHFLVEGSYLIGKYISEFDHASLDADGLIKVKLI